MNYLSPSEEEVLECLLQIREYFTVNPKRKGKYSFLDMMTYLRDMIKKLENKRYGNCITGRHSGNCTCESNKVGIYIQSHVHSKTHADL